MPNKQYTMKHLSLMIIFVLTLSLIRLTAQQVISSGGTHAKGSGVALSWTVGEPVIGTLTNGTYTLTQGFHQSRLSSTSIDEIPSPGLSLNVYPNPTSYVLNIKVDEGDYSQLQYSLFSLDGKVLQNNNLTRNLTKIKLQTFQSGNYLLRISRKTGETVRTFRVVKQ